MAEVKVKVQPPDADPVEIENRIIELCHQFPHGITDQVIQNEMPHIEAQQRAVAINRLLSMGQLDLLRSNTGLLYRIKETQNAGKMKGSDNQEKLVYQIIEDAGNKGEHVKDGALSLDRGRWMSEFMFSLIYAASSRPARAA
uniref:Polymerase (RNA) III (DNA directed) polypeptide F n=1 Tax=Cricetulus griseus TaxID=10029 RepID=A0A8C2LBU6_CRIGR